MNPGVLERARLMHRWRFVGEDSLQAATVLRNARHLRSSISRAYYSAYACATSALLRGRADVSSAARSNPGHAQLQELLRHNLDRRRYDGRARAEFERRMRVLHRARLMADYEPTSHVPPDVAVDCLRHASFLAERLGAQP